MKKLIILVFALMLVLPLAACGGKTDPAPSGGSTTDPGTQQTDDKGGEQTPVQTYDWPTASYISDGMKYTGTGEITRVSDESETHLGTNVRNIYVYINGSSLEDVGNYISALKTQGFTYYDPATNTSEREPELVYNSHNQFEWRGRSEDGHYLEIELNEETDDTYWTDTGWNQHEYSFNLIIQLFEFNWFSDADSSDSDIENEAEISGNGSEWGIGNYAEYTSDVPEPEFFYTIVGIINNSCCISGEAPAEEIAAWKQTLMDNGFQENRDDGTTWAVESATHYIEMNGSAAGSTLIYIYLNE